MGAGTSQSTATVATIGRSVLAIFATVVGETIAIAPKPMTRIVASQTIQSSSEVAVASVGRTGMPRAMPVRGEVLVVSYADPDPSPNSALIRIISARRARASRAAKVSPA
ncbi:MAG: hypothetical protein ACREQ5_05555 [Candidatus Dormibacteria bacterium]